MATIYNNEPAEGFKRLTCGGYNAGHPWYYLLGGAVPTLRQIRTEAVGSGYRGYLAGDIDAVAKRAEPKRSEGWRKIRTKVVDDLCRDISRYRQVTFKLHAHRRVSAACELGAIACDDIHVSMSLKHAHIYNGFAHLNTLDNLSEQQGDLFEL